MKKKAYKHSKLYTPQNGDTLDKIAKRETTAGNKISADDIAHFNWGTKDPDTINEKLRDDLGCHQRDADNNYVITDDCKAGVLKIPLRFKLKSKRTDTVYKIKIKKIKKPPKQFVACAKIKGVSFEANTSFIRPSVVDDLKPLEEAAKKYPDAKAIIYGHVDDDELKAPNKPANREANQKYQKELSERRAKSVFAFITNDVATWEKLYNDEKWGAKAVYEILKDLGYNLENPNAKAAVKKFQQDKGIAPPNGVPDAKTRKELFTAYMKGKHDVKLDAGRFVDPKYMGCSKFNPEGKPDQMNRRAVIYLFHKDRVPTFPCSLGDNAPCTHQMKPPKNRYSKRYNCSFYDSIAKGCDRMAADAAKALLWIHLKLVFIDPEDKTKVRPFPKEMPVKVVYKDGSSEKHKLKDKGKLSFLAKRAKQSFSLHFERGKTPYLVVEPPGQEAKVELASAKKVKDLLEKKHRLFLLPKKWSTEISDWKADPAALWVDGRFDPLSGAGSSIGTEAGPVTLKLDPHWLYVRLEFFDRKYGHSHHNHKRVSIPPVLLLGMRKVKLKKVSTKKYNSPETACCWAVKIADAAKMCQAVPWILTKDAKKKALPKLDKELVLELGNKNRYVHSKSDTDREIVTIDPKTKAGKDKLKLNKDRYQYYDLPALWKSVNYYTRLPGAGKRFGDLTEAEIATAHDVDKPLTFSLDDLVLVTTKGSQEIKDRRKNGNKVALSADSRIALLYMDAQDANHKHRVKVYKPRTPARVVGGLAQLCYWSDLEFRRNLITDVHVDARVVVFCSGFYHIFDRRAAAAKGFKFSKGQILGARAAMLNDARVSARRTVNQGSGTCANKYHAKDTGNFDLHYAHLGGVDGDKVKSMLVTYWSARYKAHQHNPADTPAKVAANNAATQGRLDHIELGLYNAMQRWNGMSDDRKKYKVERHTGTDNKIEIEPFCLFEAKQDDRGGKHKCTVTVQGVDRSSMALNTATFGPGTYQASGAACPADFDGATAARLTVAHELGHATGLDDEYLEKLSYVPGPGPDRFYFRVPQYGQYYHGMPYSIDDRSMMRSNKVQRMRHLWCRVNWLSAGGTALNKFLSGAKLKVSYKVAAPAKTLGYELTNATFRNLYRRAVYAGSHNLGTAPVRAPSDLILYKMGDDELAELLPPAAVDHYDAILVVRTNIQVSFRPAASWTDNNRRDWLVDLQAEIELMLENEFRLEGAAGDYRQTFVAFIPHYRIAAPNPIPGNTAAYLQSGSTHFTIRVTKNGGAAFNTNNTTTLNVEDGCDKKKIIRRLFGQKAGTAALALADLGRLQAWATANMGGAFNVRAI